MSNTIQVQNRPSLLIRTRDALRRLARNRRGAELVEVLVVLAIIALGGIAAMGKIKGAIDGKSDQVKGSIDGIVVGG